MESLLIRRDFFERRYEAFAKREDLQPVFSFKLRGAYNKIASLSPEERAQGIVCCSAGNHAQGVAYAAAKLGISARIFMPERTPSIKAAPPIFARSGQGCR